MDRPDCKSQHRTKWTPDAPVQRAAAATPGERGEGWIVGHIASRKYCGLGDQESIRFFCLLVNSTNRYGDNGKQGSVTSIISVTYTYPPLTRVAVVDIPTWVTNLPNLIYTISVWRWSSISKKLYKGPSFQSTFRFAQFSFCFCLGLLKKCQV